MYVYISVHVHLYTRVPCACGRLREIASSSSHRLKLVANKHFFWIFLIPWTVVPVCRALVDTNQKLCTAACPVTPVATLLPRAAAVSESTGEISLFEAASELESSNCDANALENALHDSEIHNAEMSFDFWFFNVAFFAAPQKCQVWGGESIGASPQRNHRGTCAFDSRSTR